MITHYVCLVQTHYVYIFLFTTAPGAPGAIGRVATCKVRRRLNGY